MNFQSSKIFQLNHFSYVFQINKNKLSEEILQVIDWAKKIKKNIEHEVSLDNSFKGLGRLLKKSLPKFSKLKVKMIDSDGKVWRVCRSKGRRKKAVRQGVGA